MMERSGLVAQQRNIVLVGAPAPARRISPFAIVEAASALAGVAASSIRWILNTMDLVDRLEAEARAWRQRR